MLIGTAMMSLCLGGIGDSKLIVSLSLGSSVTFKWKAKSCSANEGYSCRLHHGDLLVMDGRCQGRVSSLYESWSGGETDETLRTGGFGITHSVVRWLLECWVPYLLVLRGHPFWDLVLRTLLFRNLCIWGCWWFCFVDCLIGLARLAFYRN